LKQRERNAPASDIFVPFRPAKRNNRIQNVPNRAKSDRLLERIAQLIGKPDPDRDTWNLEAGSEVIPTTR